MEIKKYSGNEKLTLNGKEYPFSMINFWQMALSDLLLNMNRGTFAEFIVRCALETGGFPALSESRSGIESYDITGPECFTSRGESKCRIEVKSAASIQKTTPDEKEPLSLPPNRIVFSIKKAINFNTADKIPRRNNDMYVFCHYKAERKSDNIFDLALWDFYVYPTYKIDNDNIDKKISNQKTISLARLQKLGVKPCNFTGLSSEIYKVASDITKYYKSL